MTIDEVTKLRAERGEKITTATVDVHRDERLSLREAWVSGKDTRDGRAFEACRDLGGFTLTLKAGDRYYSCDLTPILQALLDATLESKR